MAQDFGFLHLDLVLFFDLADFHRLGDHLLLHDVGLDVVGLVGLRLLLLGQFEILRLLDFEIAVLLRLVSPAESVSASTRS